MKRIEQIDALRGFALFGILLTHMVGGFVASLIPPQYVDFNIQSSLDEVSRFVIQNFFIGKFYAIFSFLFGISFYLILGKKKGSGSWRFAWRMVLLFVIGFFHHIHYRGDFLTVYAVFGLVLILFRNVPDRFILVLGLFLAFNGPMVLSKGMALAAPAEQQHTTILAAGIPPAGKNPIELANAYFTLVLNGEYKALIESNATIGFENKINYLKFSGRVCVIPGLFLLGLWFGRMKLHEQLEALPLKTIIVSAAMMGLPALVISYYSSQPGNTELIRYLGFVALHSSNIFVPVMYIGLVLYLFKYSAAQTLLKRLVPVGRMGLSVYVLQSAVGVLLFYGYGFGLLLRMPATIALGVGVIIFLLIALLSHWWFKKYEFGPLEWVWRSATQMKIQPNISATKESGLLISALGNKD